MSNIANSAYFGIWERYERRQECSFTRRHGFEAIGAANPSPDLSPDATEEERKEFFRAQFRIHGENDNEHQGKCAWLAKELERIHPGFIGGERYYVAPEDSWNREMLLLIHDVGEPRIGGDVLDDGGPAHAAKDAKELIVVEEYLNTYPTEKRNQLLRLFKSFQVKNTREAQALVGIDKTEAILMVLWLESIGANPRVTHKAQPSKEDSKYMELAGTDRAADVWYMHMIMRTAKDFPPEIMNPLIALIHTAACDVRGEEFPSVLTT